MADNPGYVTLRAGQVLIDIQRVPERGKIRVIFLSEFDGLYTHWIPAKKGKGHGVPCMDDACKSTFHGEEPAWRGYAAAFYQLPDCEKFARCVFELSAILLEDLRPFMPLRGQCWDCFKVSAGKRVEMRGVLVKQYDTIEDPFDYVPHVENLYKQKRLKWGKKPPFQARVFTAPVEFPDLPSDKPAIISIEAARASQAEAQRLLRAEIEAMGGRGQ